MQDMTSPIQPTSSGGHECKKPSCWLYGLAVVGGCSLILYAIVAVLLVQVWSAVKPYIQDGGSPFSSSSFSFEIDGEAITPESFQPTVVDGQLQLSDEQKNLLDMAGIDPAKIEGQDPDVLRSCAEAQVGAERAAQLESGEASPSLSDFLALKRCLE